jgi:peroxiredoxin
VLHLVVRVIVIIVGRAAIALFKQGTRPDMTRHRFFFALCAGAIGISPLAAFAQQHETREQVNARYAELYNKLEAEHIGALTKVAASEEGEAADATYKMLFSLAIARNEYPAAESAAEAVMKKGSANVEVEMLAHFINVIAESDRGKYDESLKDLKSYMDAHQGERSKVDPDQALALGEAYFQRVVAASRYDIAREVCEFAAKSPHKAVREHFAKRAKRLDMLDQPAPAISGVDVDGKKVDLASMKGKVVLVYFWATWCPPCSLQMIRLNTLRQMYKDKDFEILGVNVDALRDNAKTEEIEPLVRRYLIDHQAAFPNLLVKDGDSSIPKAYGVEEIPANFLVDKAGKIIQFELSEGTAQRAVDAALNHK